MAVFFCCSRFSAFSARIFLLPQFENTADCRSSHTSRQYSSLLCHSFLHWQLLLCPEKASETQSRSWAVCTGSAPLISCNLIFLFRRDVRSLHWSQREVPLPERDCRFAGVVAGVSFHFGNSLVLAKRLPVRIFSADRTFFTPVLFPISWTGPWHFSGSIVSRSHRCSAFRHAQLRLTEDLWDLYRNGTCPAPVSFPTLPSSAAVMLMPSIAQLDALGEQKQIRRVTDQDLFRVHVPGI